MRVEQRELNKEKEREHLYVIERERDIYIYLNQASDECESMKL